MSPTVKGALWMLGAIVSFPVMAISGRELSQSLDTFELMMYRSAIGFLIVALLLTMSQRWQEVTTQRLGTHILRNLVHFAGQNLWFYAIAMIPLAQVFALEFTTPIWVIVLSPLLVGERLTGMRAACAAIGFAGILIVARPGQATLDSGLLAAAGCAIFFALTYLTTKQLTRSVTVGCILFYLTGIQLLLGLAAAAWDRDVAWPSAADWPFVVAVAVGGLVAHYCITRALSLAPAAIVAPIDFARLPVIAILGWLLYAEALEPAVLVGAVLIFGANYLNIWTETRRRVA
jgi:drug/metabolite transporter (DMT)-like permease